MPEYSTQVDGTTLINHYTPGQTSVTVTKSWSDRNDQDGLRPNSIQVQLYADGQVFGEPVLLDEGNQWTTTWSGLAEKAAGQTIHYTVKEVETAADYEVTINDENQGNILITNTHLPEITEINGKKVWDDTNNQDGKRPSSVTVNLLANGEVVATKEASEKNNWTYQFTQLPKYQAGQEISYTVTENTVPEYSSQIEGTNITNHYTPGQTSVTVTKSWNDSNDQDGLRPSSIKVQLYANGKASGNPVLLNKENQWTTTWSDLAEKAAGQTIHYTVKEVSVVEGYEVTINDTNQGNILIKNTHNVNELPSTNDSTHSDNDTYPSTGEKQHSHFLVIGSLMVFVIGAISLYQVKKHCR